MTDRPPIFKEWEKILDSFKPSEVAPSFEAEEIISLVNTLKLRFPLQA